MTLKKIAELAGVSIATVSYALNDSAPVSPKTKKRILAIANDVGYRSNAIAKSLRVNKTHTIGIVVEDITVPQTAKIIDGINQTTESRGYNTILSNLRLLSKVKNRFESVIHYKNEIAAVLNNLLSLQVDGIIYVGIHDRNVAEMIPMMTKPFVYCYCYTDNPNDVCVLYDNTEISAELTHWLISQGHKRIGVITGSIDSAPSQKRLEGFRRAMIESNLPVDPNYIKTGDWNHSKAKVTALELLDADLPPTAIYAMNDQMALGVYDAAMERKMTIPLELSVVGFDNDECIRYIRPALSTIECPLQEMGDTATRALLSIIDDEPIQKSSICLPCTLIRGNSVATVQHT